jgi:hypothetical protein
VLHSVQITGFYGWRLSIIASRVEIDAPRGYLKPYLDTIYADGWRYCARCQTLVIISYTSPQQTSIRGRVVGRITGPEAEEHIDKLAIKYTGEKFKWRQPGSRRIILKIKPEKIILG